MEEEGELGNTALAEDVFSMHTQQWTPAVCTAGGHCLIYRAPEHSQLHLHVLWNVGTAEIVILYDI